MLYNLFELLYLIYFIILKQLRNTKINIHFNLKKMFNIQKMYE